MLDHFTRPLFFSWDHLEPFEAAQKLQFGVQATKRNQIQLYGVKF